MSESQPTNENEHDLILRFQAGDEAAFQTLVERYETMLAARIQGQLPHRLRRRMAVSDVVQETLLAAHDHCQDLREGSERALRSWLLTIAERKVREVIRRHEAAAKRDIRREITRAQRGMTAAFRGGESTPSQAAMSAEATSLARQVMARLPADYQEVLRLAQHEHLNLAEAAERMGRSHAATRQLYGRALRRFREEFMKRGGTQP